MIFNQKCNLIFYDYELKAICEAAEFYRKVSIYTDIYLVMWQYKKFKG